MVRWALIGALVLVGCSKKTPEASVEETSTASSESSSAGSASSSESSGSTSSSTTQASTGSSSSSSSSSSGSAPERLDCSVKDGGPVDGPDCVTAEISCGETVVGHTKGGVNLYDTKFYERNTCWPATRNHNGGDERVYMFVADRSPRFQAGETRQRVTVTFDSPCADLSFTKMVGTLGTCPRDTARFCDTANPFTRKGDKSRTNITVDAGEVYYFLVEGADEAEGAFSITLECGT